MDFAILDFIQENLRCGFLDAVMPVITVSAKAGLVWIGLAVLLVISPKTRKAGAAVAVALILHLIVVNITLKPLVDRPRPFEINTAIELIAKAPHDGSFPSGHSSASFAAATAVFLYNRQMGIAALVLAAVIAFSRLYLYFHFPTDVLAGTLIGVGLGYLSKVIIEKFSSNKNNGVITL